MIHFTYNATDLASSMYTPSSLTENEEILMTNPLKDIVVISHAQCTDGWGSIHAMFALYGHKANYLTFSHTNAEACLEDWIHLLKDQTIIVVDYALPVNIWLKLVDIAEQVITLDHHYSAYMLYQQHTSDIIDMDSLTLDQIKNKKVITVFDMNYSGAMLAMKFAKLHDIEFTQNELELYALIQDMDLFRLVYADTHHLYSAISNTAMFSDCLKNGPHVLPDKELNDSLDFYDSVIADLDTVLKDGKTRYKMFQEQVANLAKQASNITLTIEKNNQVHSFNGKIINANSLFASALGSHLAEEANSFAMIYSVQDNKVKISFRSVKSFDCSQIATLFGGGGHKQASACIIDLPTLTNILTSQTIHL